MRASGKDSVKTLDIIRDLGVDVKMLTGDSFSTAKNIASQLGLGTKVATMAMIHEAKTEKSIHTIIEDTQCIAEIYPEDKFSIVKTLQSAGHFVGMTGDGVNDAPALAQAEVGIAVENASELVRATPSGRSRCPPRPDTIPAWRLENAFSIWSHTWGAVYASKSAHSPRSAMIG